MSIRSGDGNDGGDQLVRPEQPRVLDVDLGSPGLGRSARLGIASSTERMVSLNLLPSLSVDDGDDSKLNLVPDFLLPVENASGRPAGANAQGSGRGGGADAGTSRPSSDNGSGRSAGADAQGPGRGGADAGTSRPSGDTGSGRPAGDDAEGPGRGGGADAGTSRPSGDPGSGRPTGDDAEGPGRGGGADAGTSRPGGDTGSGRPAGDDAEGPGRGGDADAGTSRPSGDTSVRPAQSDRVRLDLRREGRLVREESPFPSAQQFPRVTLPDFDGVRREASHPCNVPGLDRLPDGQPGRITHSNWDGTTVEARVTRSPGTQVIEYDRPAQVVLINGGGDGNCVRFAEGPDGRRVPVVDGDGGRCVPIVDATRIETTMSGTGSMTTIITTSRGDRYTQTHSETGIASAIQSVDGGVRYEGWRGQIVPSVVRH